MLGPGAEVPDVNLWAGPREEALPLREILGPGITVVLFYVYDWSPT